MTETFAFNSDAFAAEVFDTEIVVLNLIDGTYYALGGSAIEIWPLLSSGEPLAHIADEIVRIHKIPLGKAAEAVSSFSASLASEGILNHAAATNEKMAMTAHLKTFVPLTIEKNADMQDLLTLDPIHDVNPEKGWPVI
jgi:hypothetical protein